MLDEILNAFSLNQKEKNIFQLLLELGNQPASIIAKRSSLSRNTVRGILDKLVRVGIVVRSRRVNTNYYCTEKKQNLIRLLNQRKENISLEIDNQIDIIKNHGEILDSKSKGQNRPQITFYDGYDGLKKVYEDTLTAENGLRSWGSFDANQEALPGYFKNYYKRRARLNIHMKSIHPRTDIAEENVAHNKGYLRKSVLIPVEEFQIGPEIQIYNDKVNIVSWKDRMGIIIESSEIAEAMISIFDLNYQLATKEFGERS